MFEKGVRMSLGMDDDRSEEMGEVGFPGTAAGSDELIIRGVAYPLQQEAHSFFQKQLEEAKSDALRAKTRLSYALTRELERAAISETHRLSILTPQERNDDLENARRFHGIPDRSKGDREQRYLQKKQAIRAKQLQEKVSRKLAEKNAQQAVTIAVDACAEQRNQSVRAAERERREQSDAAVQSSLELEESIRALIARAQHQLSLFLASYQELMKLRLLSELTAKQEKERARHQKVVYHWLPIILAILSDQNGGSFKLRLISCLSATDPDIYPQGEGSLLESTYWAKFKAAWIEVNWYRLFILRIKRLIIAFGEIFAATSATFSQAYDVMTQIYSVLGHLGYLIYVVRLAFHSISKLVTAFVEEGVAGLVRVWKQESLSILNDVVWASVGVAGFFIASTFGCMMMIVALYLFDIVNIAIHGHIKYLGIKKQIKAHDKHIEELTAILGAGLPDKMDLLKEEIKKSVYQEKIQCAPKELQDATRLAIAKELLQKNHVFDYKGQVSHILAEYSRLYTERKSNKSSIVNGLIEATGLFVGMALVGGGVAAVATTTGLGLTGTITIAALAMTAAAAIPVLGLALIAAGSAFVIAVCVIRLVKKIVDRHREEAMKARVKSREENAGLQLMELGRSKSNHSDRSPTFRRTNREVSPSFGRAGSVRGSVDAILFGRRNSESSRRRCAARSLSARPAVAVS